MIHRIERHLESESAISEATVAALNLAAANAGLPARRPDWIERGSIRSAELLTGGEPIDLAEAIILRSWIPALTDAPRAIEMLHEAFDLAENAGASALANVARAYEAVHVALAGGLAESRRILDALQPRLPTHLDNASNVALLMRMAVGAIDGPVSAMADVRRWDLNYVDQPVRNPLLTAMVMGAVGDTRETIRRLDHAVDDFRRFSADSGLPDLLIPPAALAFSRGDTERCRRLITAVRRSPVPTQNFMHTVLYRLLRDRVGLVDENPLDHQPIEQVFQDAREWMDTLDPADDPSHSTQPPPAR